MDMTASDFPDQLPRVGDARQGRAAGEADIGDIASAQEGDVLRDDQVMVQADRPQPGRLVIGVSMNGQRFDAASEPSNQLGNLLRIAVMIAGEMQLLRGTSLLHRSPPLSVPGFGFAVDHSNGAIALLSQMLHRQLATGRLINV